MHELAFIKSKSVALDAAVMAYIDMYGEDLPDNAVQAIRVVTRLGTRSCLRRLRPLQRSLAWHRWRWLRLFRCRVTDSSFLQPCIVG
jgi:hypothetical protein